MIIKNKLAVVMIAIVMVAVQLSASYQDKIVAGSSLDRFVVNGRKILLADLLLSEPLTPAEFKQMNADYMARDKFALLVVANTANAMMKAPGEKGYAKVTKAEIIEQSMVVGTNDPKLRQAIQWAWYNFAMKDATKTLEASAQ